MNALKKISQSAANHLATQLETMIDVDWYKCESPIETNLVAAIVAFTYVDFEYELCSGRACEENSIPGGVRNIGIETQVACEGKRIDIVLSCCQFVAGSNGEDLVKKSHIAIECDGFKYHHGDPVRAAKDKERDRLLAPHFDALIRFTGAEINADPFSCALQAVKVLEAKS